MAKNTYYRQGIFSLASRPPSTLCAVPLNTKLTDKSKYNSGSEPAKPAAGQIWSLIHLLFNAERHFGIAYCDSRKELALEMNAVKSQTRKVLIYNTLTQTVSFGALDEQNNFVANSMASVQYIATLQMLHLITSDADMEKVWRDVQVDFVNGGSQRIYQGTAVSRMLDAMYYSIGSAFPNPDLETEITEVTASTTVNGFRDITEDVLGIPGEFKFISIATPKASKSTKTPKEKEKDLLFYQNEVNPVTEAFYNSLSEDDKNLIPILDGKLANYQIDEMFVSAVEMMKNSILEDDLNAKSVLIMGPPGTGKTLFGQALAFVFRLPLRYTQGHKDVTAADFIGAPIAENGVLHTNTNTPAVTTCRRGGMFLFDDISNTNPGYTTCLLPVLENPFAIQTATGEVVKRHPMSFIFMTGNVDCAGCYPVNEALRSRAFIVHNRTYDDMKSEQIINMVANESKYPSLKEVAVMYNCYEAIRADIKNNPAMAGAIEPSFRNLIAWAKQAKVMGNPVKAALHNLIPSLNVSREDERRILTTIIQQHFPPKYHI